MTTLLRFALAIGVAGSVLAGCSESSFSSSNGKKAADAAPPGTPTPPPSSPPAQPPTDCVEGDKVNFAWTGEVRECIIDQGKTYNFDSGKCAEMRQASFDCSWENLVAAMQDMGLSPTEKIERDRNDGAKLVTCGQSKDKNRIVVQWIRPPEGGFKCEDAKARGLITTGCYTVYKEGEQPPKPANDEERKKQVYDCMNSL